MTRKFLLALASLLALVLGLVASVPPATSSVATAGAPTAAAGHRHRLPRPVIFVHGGAGSGAQFESQGMRLTSNGYPADRVAVLEYDSTFGTNTMAQVHTRLDELIAGLLRRTGADKVDLLGHSLGTGVSQSYLSTPERAARVAHYVNIDGAQAAAPPGGVPTLAVWGEGSQTRQIVGATNYYAPTQAHVQVATSAETFAQFYKFFTGRRARTTNVVPERPDRVRISGEANLFPSNQGAEGTTLNIYEVSSRTGKRLGRAKATFAIGADGAWGPFRAHGHKRYELALTNTTGTTHHFYFQPFLRSDHLVRLLTSTPGTGIDLLRERSDRHESFTIVRYKEWWGDQAALGDSLKIDGLSLLNAANAPRTKRVNAIFTFDAGSDGVTNLAAPLPALFALPFITGMDVFIPATTPPDDTVSVRMTARAGDGRPEVINVPNWASSQHHSTLQFRDFEQRDERWGPG
jgi:pimeloyl-ACP methyl ester carboxylesterase